jgi:YHS domain-containing protein
VVRVVLFIILFVIIARAFWRIVDNVVQAASGQPPRGSAPTAPSATMVRDPVCGTFVLPERSLSIADRRGRAYFCSENCRDKYRAKSA